MNEQWYCRSCGPIADIWIGSLTDFVYCQKCNARPIEPPAHVTAMQNRIAALEKVAVIAMGAVESFSHTDSYYIEELGEALRAAGLLQEKES